MYPNRFRYYRPESLAEAVRMLGSLGDEAKPLAGGQSLIPLMKLRLVQPTVLVDLDRVPGLRHRSADNGVVCIGALTRHRALERWRPQPGLEILSDAAGVIADVQVRNRGTVGGALAQADPAGDWATAFLALDGEVHAVGGAGERSIPIREFFVDAYTTALQTGEIVTDVRFRAPASSAYLALKRRAGDFAVASAAVSLTVDERGVCRRAGIGVGGVGLTPIRAWQAEALLVGTRLQADAVQEAAAVVERTVQPIADVRGGEEYKREVVAVLVRRAVEMARRRGAGEEVRADAYL